MTLGSIFRKPVVTAVPSQTLAEIAKAMAHRHVGTVVIVESGRPVGIVTDRDIALALGARGLALNDPVRHVMTSPVVTIEQDEGIMAATRMMRENAARRLPVVDTYGRVVGLVSADDLLVILGRELQNVADAIVPEVEASQPLAETI